MKNLQSGAASFRIFKSLDHTTGGQPNVDGWLEAASRIILKAMDEGESALAACPDCENLKTLLADVIECVRSDDSPEVKACVAKKIPILIEEGYEQKQAVAIAYSMCRKDTSAAEKGKEVPKYTASGEKRWLSDEDLSQFGRKRLKEMTRPPVPVQKEGTSEGARLGWETRRHGGGPAEEGKPEKGEYQIKQDFNAFESLKKKEEVTYGGEKITVLANHGYASRLPGSDTEYGHKGASRYYKVLGYTSEAKDARDLFFDRKTGNVLVFDGKGKLLSGERPKPEEAAKREEPKPAEKPESVKPKPLTTWDVKNAGNSIASKLRGINAETRDGRRIREIKVQSVTEDKDGIFVEMYAEGLKVGGPDDDDRNDSLAQAKLLDDGEKIVQEKFPDHDVHAINGEKGYFGFQISPKKAAGESRVKKEGTSEGALRGWETRRAGGVAGGGAEEAKQDLPEPTKSEQAHEVLAILEARQHRPREFQGEMTARIDRLAEEGNAKKLMHFANELAGSGEKNLANDARKRLAEMGYDKKGKVIKAGTSEGAKKGWETRRGGTAPEEELAPTRPSVGAERVPSAEQWRSMQSDADAMFDANDKFRRWEVDQEKMGEALREAGKKPHVSRRIREGDISPEFEDQLNALQDVAPKAANVAAGLRGVPGVDEAKRSRAEATMRNFDKRGIMPNEAGKFDEAVSDIWNMLDDARAGHDPKYKTEKALCDLAEALFKKDVVVRPAIPIHKEGTSEGAKKGWETRKGGAAGEPEDKKEPKKPEIPTYPAKYKGEVRQVTVPPREEEEEKKPPKIPLASVSFDTGKYRFSAGKEPKGRGRWAFQIGDKTEFFDGDFAEAKGQAARTAAERGHRRVEVLP